MCRGEKRGKQEKRGETRAGLEKKSALYSAKQACYNRSRMKKHQAAWNILAGF